jgi:drug/metabolite transporter (DMT)-like permease
VFLIAVFVLSGGKFTVWRKRRDLACIIISGVGMGASWMFLYEAYVQIGVSIATLAYYCGPVIVMVLAPALFGERMTTAKLLGFLAVLLGMFCVNGRTLLENGLSWGLLCGILSAVMYSFMVIFNKMARSINGLENAICQLAVSFLTVAVFTVTKQGLHISIPSGSAAPILLLGLINTGAGCYFYFSSIQRLSAQSVAICGYIEPLSALFFSAALLHERLTPAQIAGAALIIGGAAFGECFKRKNGRARKSEPEAY